MQTGIGQRQNRSDQCRDRIEAELAKSGDGQVRPYRSKDRIYHWAAKAREEALIEQKVGDGQCTGNGEMKPEDNKTTAAEQIVEHTEMRQPEEFNISGSSVKKSEDDIELSLR